MKYSFPRSMGNLFLFGLVLLSPPGFLEAKEPALASALSPPFIAPENPDALLSRQRWEEPMHGLSLRPPLGSLLQRQTGDDALLRMVGERQSYTMILEVKNLNAPIIFDQVVQQSVVQVANMHPQARILEQARATVMGRQGSVIYFQITTPKGEKLILGQALVPINLTTLAVLRLDVDEVRFAAARPVFEGVLFSLQARETQALDRERRELIERGGNWKRGLTPDALLAAMVPPQWFRIQEQGRDIGFLFMVQGRDTSMNLPGFRVHVGTRIELGGRQVDSMSRFFLSESGDEEIWSIRTASRPAGLPGRPAARESEKNALPQEQVWSESGVRSDIKMTVTREGPEGPRRLEWVRPPQGYLSQVEIYLLGSLLPRHAAAEYGFYAYHPGEGKLSFRTEKIEPAADGSYVLRSRPSLDQPQQVSRYDAQGRLIERELGDGRKLILSNQAEVAAIFQLTDQALPVK